MKKMISILLVLAMMLAMCSCSAREGKTRFTKSFLDLFDTASTIIAYDDTQEAFNEHFEKFYSFLSEYDRLYDIYKSYDDIVNLCTVNNEAGSKPVRVDSRIIDLLLYGKEVYKLSGGRTNICFGSVLEIWHACRETAAEDPDNAVLPDMSKLRSASMHTDINNLIIDEKNCTVSFADPDMKLDVGAIAKGYAVKCATEWARENLWSSAALSIGGNVSTYGYKNDDGSTLWNIAIDNPDTSSDEYLEMLAITELSVVTSGDYQRYYEVNGKRYCHIIDPETLMPAEYASSVSVICDDSALGDALSTTLFNMSIVDGVEMINSMDNVEAVWVDKSFNKTYSKGFEGYIANQGG